MNSDLLKYLTGGKEMRHIKLCKRGLF